MITSRRELLFASAATLGACARGEANGQEPLPVDTAIASPAYETAITEGRRRVAAIQAEARYPSISGAVFVDGNIVWNEAIGYADIRARSAATTSVRYPIGSVSKTLTAAAAMRLVADGVLDLDAPIERYWRETPSHYRGITMRHLLSHQAGVRHYRLFESNRNTEYPSVEAGLAIFLDDPPLFAPDQSFQYSTYGYSLASRIMEAATGESFLALMDRLLIEPLGLSATGPDRANPRPGNLVREYTLSWRGASAAPETNSSFKWAGGGFVSTPQDLVTFGAALMGGAYLPAERFAEMTTPRRTANGEVNPQFYGLGWRIGTMPFPRGATSRVPFVNHGGQATGAESILALAPQAGMATAFCGNARTDGGSDQLVQLAADILRDFMAVREASRE